MRALPGQCGTEHDSSKWMNSRASIGELWTTSKGVKRGLDSFCDSDAGGYETRRLRNLREINVFDPIGSTEIDYPSPPICFVFLQGHIPTVEVLMAANVHRWQCSRGRYQVDHVLGLPRVGSCVLVATE